MHPGIRHLLIYGLDVTESLKSCMACPDDVIFKLSSFSRHVNRSGRELNSPEGPWEMNTFSIEWVGVVNQGIIFSMHRRFSEMATPLSSTQPELRNAFLSLEKALVSFMSADTGSHGRPIVAKVG